MKMCNKIKVLKTYKGKGWNGYNIDIIKNLETGEVKEVEYCPQSKFEEYQKVWKKKKLLPVKFKAPKIKYLKMPRR